MKIQGKRWIVCALAGILSLALPGFSQTADSPRHTISLDGYWEFHQESGKGAADTTRWLPAQVPGDVHLDLLRNKLIPDPFYRDNEAKLQWIETADWAYRKTFDVSAETLASRRVELVFLGLDTDAIVSINGELALTANNMFRAWRIDAKPLLHVGSNEVLVRFRSPLKVAEELAAKDKTHQETQIPEKSYLRKAAYEFGWDWGPRFVTSGIWQSVYLDVWNEARIANVAIQQPDVTATLAHLVANVKIVAAEQSAAQLKVSYAHEGQAAEIEQAIQLHAGDNSIDLPLQVKDPALWFPAGYGAQPLYTFKVSLQLPNRASEEKTIRTGLRSVVLNRKLDQWGRSFEFIVNGIPVFIKGTDVIPFDSFPNRVTDDRYRRDLQSAKDANMNMLRLWGGGYYENDKFYEIADELGLMVWNDFMFASSWYPGSEEWKQNVRAEAEYQVDRLRNHPSIVLWSGNNEVESVLNAYLGSTSTEGKLKIWRNYLTTFNGELPRVVENKDAEVPYWPSSPSSNYEATTDDFQSGDAHDWSIWHGREPFANFQKHFFRFTSEYGFQSFPELRTLEMVTVPEDRVNIFTPVMLAHQKNNEGNSIIHEYLLRDYSEPKDFDSFLYVSQVLQAEGIKVGAEHMRRSRPRIMGSLIWQLNDCWPVASWSSIDYYGRWKALQYYAKRFYSPILVTPLMQDGKASVYVVSDHTKPTTGTLRARVMTLDGAIVTEVKQTVTLPALSSASYIELPFQSLLEKKQDLSMLVLVTDFTANGTVESANINYFGPTKQVHLRPAKIDAEIAQTDKGYRVKLSSKVLARDVYMTFGNLDVKLTDNYLDLIPGEAVEVTLTSQASLAELRKQMSVTSLVDAFAK